MIGQAPTRTSMARGVRMDASAARGAGHEFTGKTHSPTGMVTCDLCGVGVYDLASTVVCQRAAQAAEQKRVWDAVRDASR